MSCPRNAGCVTARSGVRRAAARSGVVLGAYAPGLGAPVDVQRQGAGRVHERPDAAPRGGDRERVTGGDQRPGARALHHHAREALRASGPGSRRAARPAPGASLHTARRSWWCARRATPRSGSLRASTTWAGDSISSPVAVAGSGIVREDGTPRLRARLPRVLRVLPRRRLPARAVPAADRPGRARRRHRGRGVPAARAGEEHAGGAAGAAPLPQPSRAERLHRRVSSHPGAGHRADHRALRAPPGDQ